MSYIDKNELYYENLVRNYFKISNVPLEFQTFKIQQIALERRGQLEFLNIPKKALSEEIILYAIEKDYVDNFAFYNIPNKFKTYEVCKNAVIHYPSIIKIIPLKFITKGFLKELNESNVHISEYYMGYIKECIQANNKINGVISLNEKTTIKTSKSPKNKLPDNIKNIDLNTLIYIDPSILNDFKVFGINNLGELLDASEMSEFYMHYVEGWSYIYSKESNEKRTKFLDNTIRLLRCEYLDEAPLVDIDDDQIKFYELCYLLGVPSCNYSTLIRSFGYDCSAKEFFQKMQDQSIIEILSKNGAGKKTIFDILWRTKVILDYYKRHSNEKVQDEDNEIEYLKNELQRLREESKKIDTQIDTIIEKIQEKTLNQSKGGAIK